MSSLQHKTDEKKTEQGNLSGNPKIGGAIFEFLPKSPCPAGL
jgi:hypothetical protein